MRLCIPNFVFVDAEFWPVVCSVFRLHIYMEEKKNDEEEAEKKEEKILFLKNRKMTYNLFHN